jgi:hypothetical protein
MSTSYESVSIDGKDYIITKANDRRWIEIGHVLKITHSTREELFAFKKTDLYYCLERNLTPQYEPVSLDPLPEDAPWFFDFVRLDHYCCWLGYNNLADLLNSKKRAPRNVERLEKLTKAGFTLDGLLSAAVDPREGSKGRSAVVSERVLRAAEKLIDGEWDENA